jgi:SAM-dependent methyltransferase
LNATDDATMSARKRKIRALAEQLAASRDTWIERNRYFHDEDLRYTRFLVPPGLRVLELGCGTGRMLAGLEPRHGVGVDFSPAMIERARAAHPDLEFRVGDVEDPAVLERLDGPFDVILLSETIGELDDCGAALDALRPLCTPETRVIIAYHSKGWEPVLRLGEWLGLKMPTAEQNWLSTDDIVSLLELADFGLVKREWRLLVPRRLLGLGPFLNRYPGSLPIIRRLSLRNYVVARPLQGVRRAGLSASVIVPCRNERGNVEAAVRRIPRFCDDLEIVFVEGGSSDGTYEEIERVIAAYPERDIKVLRQDGIGKGDAVWKGFDNARGDLLMIQDADLTAPPEALPKFYRAIASGKGELVIGSRLVYPMESQAMRFLNMVANHAFSHLFSWLLNQRFTDTLCGTKVLLRADYQRLAAGRAFFGDFDPFGDFDLIFGAAKLNLKITEIPVRYADRAYGETQISRFRHGWLLIRMVVFAWRKLKAF